MSSEILNFNFIVNFFWLLSTRGFLGASDGEEFACNAGDLGLIPGSGDPLEQGMATHSSDLVGESHGQRSLADHRPGGHKESDTTELLTHIISQKISFISNFTDFVLIVNLNVVPRFY